MMHQLGQGVQNYSGTQESLGGKGRFGAKDSMDLQVYF